MAEELRCRILGADCDDCIIGHPRLRIMFTLSQKEDILAGTKENLRELALKLRYAGEIRFVYLSLMISVSVSPSAASSCTAIFFFSASP